MAAVYEYGRINTLARSLAVHGIRPDIVERIMQSGETIKQGTSPEKKAKWMGDAMRRMDELLDDTTKRSVREACACCLGGKRLEVSRRIGRTYATLAERIAAADQARLVFGHKVELRPDGRVLVQFAPDGLDRYRCPCLPKAEEPLPITYCYCCGGHVKHHAQLALGTQLAVEVLSSALSSGGTEPCRFALSSADGAVS